jgi:ankyrin repeat protein
MIHLLLDHGADPNLYSDSGHTAQEIAQNFGHTDNYLFPEKRIRDGFDLLNSHGGLYTPRDLSELVAEFGKNPFF